MKKHFLFLTITTIIGVIILLFLFSPKETLSPEQQRANAYKTDPSEYQLVIVDDSIIITDFGRPVARLHLDSTAHVGMSLIKDNE